MQARASALAGLAALGWIVVLAAPLAADDRQPLPPPGSRRIQGGAGKPAPAGMPALPPVQPQAIPQRPPQVPDRLPAAADAEVAAVDPLPTNHGARSTAFDWRHARSGGGAEVASTESSGARGIRMRESAAQRDLRLAFVDSLAKRGSNEAAFVDSNQRFVTRNAKAALDEWSPFWADHDQLAPTVSFVQVRTGRTSTEAPYLRGWHARPLFDVRRQREVRLEYARHDETASKDLTPRLDRVRLQVQPVASPLAQPSLSVPRTPVPEVHEVDAKSALSRKDVEETPTKADEWWRDYFDLKGGVLATSVILGGSNVGDGELAGLQAFDADPARRGFFVPEQVDVGFSADVFKAIGLEVMLTKPFDEDLSKLTPERLELWREIEADAFAVRAAGFRTPFGIENMRLTYDRFWLDEPIVMSRLLGKQGLYSAAGAELVWQDVSSGWRVHVGGQNGADDGMDPFVGTSSSEVSRLGGRPRGTTPDGFFESAVWFARIQKDLLVGRSTRATLGGSAVFGPNATGKDGSTRLLGLDARLEEEDAAATSWFWQTEFAMRTIEADAYQDAGGAQILTPRTLDDWALCSCALTRLSSNQDSVASRLGLGLRLDVAGGDGDSLTGAAPTFSTLPRNEDPYRDDRIRASLLVVFTPNTLLRLRFQYSYDDADHLGRAAHVFWLAFDGNWGFLAEQW